MNHISAILIVKDNPPHIHESIGSIEDFVSEIIIADIGIEENLKRILLQNPKIRILTYQTVPYVELIRQKVIQETQYDWVLLLDPDEIFPSQLKSQLEKDLSDYDFFSIPRKNIIFGQWITHSRWWPDHQIRVFKKQNVTWPTEIHHQPQTSGKGCTLENQEQLALVHYNYHTIDEYLSKAMRYAKAEASEYILRQKDYTLTTAMKQATSEFISRFFAGEGYKDGIHGFILSFFQMIYPFLVYFYYLEGMKFKTAISDTQLIQSSTDFFGITFKELLFWKRFKKKSSLKEKIIEKIINS